LGLFLMAGPGVSRTRAFASSVQKSYEEACNDNQKLSFEYSFISTGITLRQMSDFLAYDQTFKEAQAEFYFFNDAKKNGILYVKKWLGETFSTKINNILITFTLKSRVIRLNVFNCTQDKATALKIALDKEAECGKCFHYGRATIDGKISNNLAIFHFYFIVPPTKKLLSCNILVQNEISDLFINQTVLGSGLSKVVRLTNFYKKQDDALNLITKAAVEKLQLKKVKREENRRRYLKKKKEAKKNISSDNDVEMLEEISTAEEVEPLTPEVTDNIPTNISIQEIEKKENTSIQINSDKPDVEDGEMVVSEGDHEAPVKAVTPTTAEVVQKEIINNSSDMNAEKTSINDLDDVSDSSWDNSDSYRPDYCFEDEVTDTTESKSSNPSEDLDNTTYNSSMSKDLNPVSNPLPTPVTVGSDSSSNDSPVGTPLNSYTRIRKYKELSPQSQIDIRGESPEHKHLCTGGGILVPKGTTQKSQC